MPFTEIVRRKKSMNKKEFKIGEVFNLGLMKIKVENRDETKNCMECFFNELCCNNVDLCYDITGACGCWEREDGTDVVFKKVEE